MLCRTIGGLRELFTILYQFALIVAGNCGIMTVMNKVEYKRILIVEDNNELRNRLVDYFSVMNNVVACNNLMSAIKAVSESKFDIVLLDVILPDGSGLKLIEHIKQTPVIILSDLGTDSNMLDGFTAGATDYIVKPCSNAIIEARMSLRLLPEENAKISSHGLTVNMSRRTTVYNNTALNLTSSEFNILMFLMQNAGVFYTADEIYEQVWKMPHLNSSTVKMHLSNLRKKMFSVSDDCASLIISEFGKGYAFIGN